MASIYLAATVSVCNYSYQCIIVIEYTAIATSAWTHTHSDRGNHLCMHQIKIFYLFDWYTFYEYHYQ